jgi:hypothetical protein
MTDPVKDERRIAPRFKVWASCSLLPHLGDADRRQHAVLGYVKDLSREAVAVLLPLHEVYGVDAASLGRPVQLKLGLPIGYIQLSATLIRHSPDESGKHLVVFRIEESEHRHKYYEFIDSLRSE